jgi:excisionase family DNA binding protein
MDDEPLPVLPDDEDQEPFLRTLMDGAPISQWIPLREGDDPGVFARSLAILHAHNLPPWRAAQMARLELLAEKAGQPATPATESSAELLTVKETAAVLRAQPNYVYELLARGELPAVHVGRKKLVRRGDLDAFVRRGGTTPDDDD